ncbi:hypothetical protein DLAC_06869 [Tieghemostelium lacteum]|uniref:DUF1772 domain-containing protein n=1 Tax=Tieghemostelium lacteum TaxID=361077 RepID=A0A151ZDJ8_TIELA|nr:hypothetical protein DLAC_06869 [Tieghemostelium lacteum]|eukprot:KYQ92038.1 hypothetical protein DLAC_06869 [Tieghemostelium lacteum]
MSSRLCDYIPILKGLALVSGSIFAGIAVYIRQVEHPARLSIPNEQAVDNWRVSFNRAMPLQVSLAIMSSLSAAITWAAIYTRNHSEITTRAIKHSCNCDGWMWLIGGGLMASVIPFTLWKLAPVNRKLLDQSLDKYSEETRSLLIKWGELHNVRVLLSFSAMSIFFVKLFVNQHHVVLVK